MGRFINADALVSTGQGILGNNMYAYCGNNPVVCIDSSGTIPSYAFFGDNHVLSENILLGGNGGGNSRVSIPTSRQASREVIDLELQRAKKIAFLFPAVKAGFGIYQISAGFGMLALPWPGLVDEIKGWRRIRKGFWNVMDAIEIAWELLGG